MDSCEPKPEDRDTSKVILDDKEMELLVKVCNNLHSMEVLSDEDERKLQAIASRCHTSCDSPWLSITEIERELIVGILSYILNVLQAEIEVLEQSLGQYTKEGTGDDVNRRKMKQLLVKRHKEDDKQRMEEELLKRQCQLVDVKVLLSPLEHEPAVFKEPLETPKPKKKATSATKESDTQKTSVTEDSPTTSGEIAEARKHAVAVAEVKQLRVQMKQEKKVWEHEIIGAEANLAKAWCTGDSLSEWTKWLAYVQKRLDRWKGMSKDERQNEILLFGVSSPSSSKTDKGKKRNEDKGKEEEKEGRGKESPVPTQQGPTAKDSSTPAKQKRTKKIPDLAEDSPAPTQQEPTAEDSPTTTRQKIGKLEKSYKIPKLAQDSPAPTQQEPTVEGNGEKTPIKVRRMKTKGDDSPAATGKGPRGEKLTQDSPAATGKGPRGKKPTQDSPAATGKGPRGKKPTQDSPAATGMVATEQGLIWPSVRSECPENARILPLIRESSCVRMLKQNGTPFQLDEINMGLDKRTDMLLRLIPYSLRAKPDHLEPSIFPLHIYQFIRGIPLYPIVGEDGELEPPGFVPLQFENRTPMTQIVLIPELKATEFLFNEGALYIRRESPLPFNETITQFSLERIAETMYFKPAEVGEILRDEQAAQALGQDDGTRAVAIVLSIITDKGTDILSSPAFNFSWRGRQSTSSVDKGFYPLEMCLNSHCTIVQEVSLIMIF